MNNKDDDKWLKNLRDRMEDYSEPLPEGLWEELEGELNQPANQTKVIPFWRRWPSVAAAVALVLIINSLTLSHWLSPLIDDEDIQLAGQLVLEDQETNAVPVAVAVADEGSDEVVEMKEEPQLVAVQHNTKTKSVQSEGEGAMVSYTYLGAVETESSDKEADTNSTAIESEGWTLHESNAEGDSSNDKNSNNVGSIDMISSDMNSNDKKSNDINSTETNSSEIASKKVYSTSTRARTTADAGYSMRRKKNHSGGGVELGLHTGGIPYNSSKQFAGMSRMASHQTLNLKGPIVVGSVNSKLTPYNQVLFSNRDKQTSTDVKHRMPINVVASLKWHFADDWALESGVSYTFLQSELHSGSHLYWEDTQKLHYVGVPIKVHRDLWENSTFSFYASAGGMVEKCVSGSLESVYVTGSDREVEHHSVHEHPFQWSLAAAVGAQVNLVRSLSLFVEPGVAYFFDDNSRLETIRKEHPLNFNLQFGIRFSLND